MKDKNNMDEIFQANREFKSSVFSLLFGKPEILRKLYSAIEGVELPLDVPININTITGVLVKGLRNDISFTIDNRLIILIEHQSTISENLPLKIFKYIEKIYDKIIDYKKMHIKQLIKIPKPEFIVLYNGKEPFPEKKELRLSNAFLNTEGLVTDNNRISLELVVQVYNINHGQNQEIQQKCEILNEYSLFIEKIREYEKTGIALAESVINAVKYCIENNILKEFLREHGSEVIGIMVEEYTTEDFIEAIADEAREEGREEGREEREKLKAEIASLRAQLEKQSRDQ